MKKQPLKKKFKVNPHDPRKEPKPGYNEKNPKSKKDIQDDPGSQNTG